MDADERARIRARQEKLARRIAEPGTWVYTVDYAVLVEAEQDLRSLLDALDGAESQLAEAVAAIAVLVEAWEHTRDRFGMSDAEWLHVWGRHRYSNMDTGQIAQEVLASLGETKERIG